jgi:GNAT superfamily N-acetyltransferase
MIPDSRQISLKGYYPGVIGRITEEHARYYHDQWDFDVTFETQVSRELSDFIAAYRDQRDGLWVALMMEKFAGCVAIDGAQSAGEGARLRWFIVTAEFHGLGIGTSLIKEAVEFCRKAGHHAIYLWTFEGLDAARTLYERAGFSLAEEHEIFQWGRTIKEQMFRLNLVNNGGEKT